MYSVAICDDDLHCAKTMCKILETEFIEQDFNCEIKLVTNDQKQIYDLIKNHEIDILFLDIDFKNGGKNGIDFANELRNIDNNFCLIFLSAHIRYMPLAFVSKTFDFLIKPVHKSVVSMLIERMKKDFIKNDSTFLTFNKNLSIRVNTITYIEKQDNKCFIHTGNKIVPIVSTLDKLSEILPKSFIRCHKSVILNNDRVSIINGKENIAIFDNDETCPCSPHYISRKERRKKL